MTRPVLWTAEEIAMLRRSEIPPHRSLNSARRKASKLHIPFRPGNVESLPHNFPVEKRRKIAEDAVRYCNKSHVASIHGVSRQYVLDCCKEFGVKLIPSPHERLGEHIEYDGHNWSWKKGSWICTSSKVRATGEYNLAKVLWKKFYGVYPNANYDVRWKDGNRYNLKKSNLILLTKSEAQKRRLKDPLVYAMNYATCCMGLLINRVRDMQTPGRATARCKKAWATSRITAPDRGRKAWETRRRNAERNGYYYTEEQRKKMSCSHKGKHYKRK